MEYFKDHIAQPAVIERLTKSFLNNRIAHAYLFYGLEGGGKESFALEFAKALNCEDDNARPCNVCSSCLKIGQLNHPDIKFIFPESKNWTSKDIQKKYQLKADNPYLRIEAIGPTSISIDRIRELKNEAKFTPYEANRKVFIITDVEKMRRESANSFLKLLEEPPDNLLIILIASSLNTILDTIKSRCQIVYFPAFTVESALQILGQYRSVSEKDREVVQIAQGNLKEIFDLIDQENEDKRKIVYDFLKAAARGSSYELHKTIDSISQRKDKNFLLDILNLLILWFKDTIRLISSPEKLQVINIDYEDEIRRFSKSYAASDFDNILLEIDKAISAVKANIHVPLLLTVMGIQINKHLRRIN